MALLAASPCQEAYSLPQSTEAPCSGILVPESEAVGCIRLMSVELPACHENLDFCQKECTVRLAALDKQRKIESIRADRLEGVWREATRAAAWYEHPSVSFFGGGLVTSVAIYAWNEAH